MPHFTLEESVQLIARVRDTETVCFQVIEKLDLSEVFELIKIKPITISKARYDERPYHSLFEALLCIYNEDATVKPLSLKLLFSKLMQALDLFEQTPERQQMVAEFLAHLHLSNLFARVAGIALYTKDLQLFQQFHLLVGTDQLDKAMINAINSNAFFSSLNLLNNKFISVYLLNSISVAALGEVMLVPNARINLLFCRENVLSMLARINYQSDAFHQLLQQPDFITLMMTRLEAHELDALIFARMNNYQLNKVMTAVITHDLDRFLYAVSPMLTHWLPLLNDDLDQGKKYFRNMMYRMSPFELTHTVGMLLKRLNQDPFFQLEADQTHEKICQKIISFATAPDVAVKEDKQEFMQWLAFNLGSTQQLIVHAHKWIGVVDQAIKACEPTDHVTLNQLREYHRLLKNRPECIASNKTAANETWIELRELARSKEEKSELSFVPTPTNLALRKSQ